MKIEFVGNYRESNKKLIMDAIENLTENPFHKCAFSMIMMDGTRCLMHHASNKSVAQSLDGKHWTVSPVFP